DDGKRDMVPNTGCSLRREKVAAGGLKEFQYSLVFPRGRVRQVDDNLSAGKRFRQPLTSDGVDARLRCRCDHFMTLFAKPVHKFCTDQPGASNDYYLHLYSPFVCRPKEGEQSHRSS